MGIFFNKSFISFYVLVWKMHHVTQISTNAVLTKLVLSHPEDGLKIKYV